MSNPEFFVVEEVDIKMEPLDVINEPLNSLKNDNEVNLLCPVCHFSNAILSQMEDHLYFKHCQPVSLEDKNPELNESKYCCHFHQCSSFQSSFKSALVLHYLETHIDFPETGNKVKSSNSDLSLRQDLFKLEPIDAPIPLISPESLSKLSLAKSDSKDYFKNKANRQRSRSSTKLKKSKRKPSKHPKTRKKGVSNGPPTKKARGDRAKDPEEQEMVRNALLASLENDPISPDTDIPLANVSTSRLICEKTIIKGFKPWKGMQQVNLRCSYRLGSHLLRLKTILEKEKLSKADELARLKTIYFNLSRKKKPPLHQMNEVKDKIEKLKTPTWEDTVRKFNGQSEADKTDKTRYANFLIDLYNTIKGNELLLKSTKSVSFFKDKLSVIKNICEGENNPFRNK